jgi:hypothetical protein
LVFKLKLPGALDGLAQPAIKIIAIINAIDPK